MRGSRVTEVLDDRLERRDWRFTEAGGQLIGSGSGDVAFINVYGVVLLRNTYNGITLR